MLKFQPEHGTVMFGSDRMLIFRQAAMSTLRGLLYRQLGPELSRAILSQFGYQCGAGDFANLMQNYTWESDLDKLTSGPVLHTWEGIVHVTPTLIDYDRESGRFDFKGVWRNSYEAEIHLQQIGVSDTPVCHSLTGYASGYGTAFFGRPVLAVETACVAMGHDTCTFEMRDIDRWCPEANPWREALKSNELSLVRELETQLELIRAQQQELEDLTSRQRAAISQLSTPVMEVWKSVLVLPIIGIVDSARSQEITNTLLEAIARGQARCAIIDVTGVDVVDTGVANHLQQVVKAARLLGAYCVITGVSPGVAQTLVEIGADLSTVLTLRDLKQGLQACIRHLNGEA